MKIIGSQRRETLEEAGYTVAARLGEFVILQNESGQQSLWIKNDSFAGYVVEVDGVGYEFVRDYKG